MMFSQLDSRQKWHHYPLLIDTPIGGVLPGIMGALLIISVLTGLSPHIGSALPDRGLSILKPAPSDLASVRGSPNPFEGV